MGLLRNRPSGGLHRFYRLGEALHEIPRVLRPQGRRDDLCATFPAGRQVSRYILVASRSIGGGESCPSSPPNWRPLGRRPPRHGGCRRRSLSSVHAAIGIARRPIPRSGVSDDVGQERFLTLFDAAIPVCLRPLAVNARCVYPFNSVYYGERSVRQACWSDSDGPPRSWRHDAPKRVHTTRRNRPIR